MMHPVRWIGGDSQGHGLQPEASRGRGEYLNIHLVPPLDADIQCGSAAFGAGAVSRTGQIVAISQLTASATTQPKITSITRSSPLSTPPLFECTDRLPPMTIAAVIGAWRHITWIRTTYDASSTVIASAKGSFHGVGSPTARKTSPTAQPTRVLI